MKFDLCNVQRVPVWIKCPLLPLEFWSLQILSKIGSLLGTPLYADQFTVRKERLGYARILVEMEISGEFPESVTLIDEEGLEYTQAIEYEWRPILCTICKGDGHTHDQCPNAQGRFKRVWQVKQTPKSASPTTQAETTLKAQDGCHDGTTRRDSITDPPTDQQRDPMPVTPLVHEENTEAASAREITLEQATLEDPSTANEMMAYTIQDAIQIATQEKDDGERREWKVGKRKGRPPSRFKC